jgi:hypothetical protein
MHGHLNISIQALRGISTAIFRIPWTPYGTFRIVRVRSFVGCYVRAPALFILEDCERIIVFAGIRAESIRLINADVCKEKEIRYHLVAERGHHGYLLAENEEPVFTEEQ